MGRYDAEWLKLEKLKADLLKQGRLTANIEGCRKTGKWGCWLLGEQNEWGGVWLYPDGTKINPKGESCGTL